MYLVVPFKIYSPKLVLLRLLSIYFYMYCVRVQTIIHFFYLFSAYFVPTLYLLLNYSVPTLYLFVQPIQTNLYVLRTHINDYKSFLALEPTGIHEKSVDIQIVYLDCTYLYIFKLTIKNLYSYKNKSLYLVCIYYSAYHNNESKYSLENRSFI